ncbi:unnamed protein product, partial [Cylicocyclus nassatus]
MNSLTVFSLLSLLIVNSLEMDTNGRNAPMRSLGEEPLLEYLTPLKYRRRSQQLNSYGDLSSLMRSMDELQRP